ncbi:hypothetical protein QR680_000777 [Steinernema hermaphroditum]|uniref:Uncharacterized protein n=1 Tax=Steinernema hermaphroditum TaxID=289476 RepID=A0AA39GVV8_9BILA|nr:hypothetical protein QR680_000777 [Steinernema hermaphroditum]
MILIILGLIASSNAHRYNQTFSPDTGPCENFYEYVCYPRGNNPDDYFVAMLRRNLLDDQLRTLLNSDDKILNAIVHETAEVGSISPGDLHKKTVHNRFSKRDLPSAPSIPKSKESVLRDLIGSNGPLHSHVRMVLSKMLLGKDTFPDDIENDLYRMFDLISNEFDTAVSQSEKLTSSQKDCFSNKLDPFVPEFGMFDVVRDQQIIDTYFHIAQITIWERYQMMDSNSSHIERLHFLEQSASLAWRRLRATYATYFTDKYANDTWVYNIESVSFQPYILRAAAVDVPVGFKYGFIGTVMAEKLNSILHSCLIPEETQRRHPRFPDLEHDAGNVQFEPTISIPSLSTATSGSVEQQIRSTTMLPKNKIQTQNTMMNELELDQLLPIVTSRPPVLKKDKKIEKVKTTVTPKSRTKSPPRTKMLNRTLSEKHSHPITSTAANTPPAIFKSVGSMSSLRSTSQQEPTTSSHPSSEASIQVVTSLDPKNTSSESFAPEATTISTHVEDSSKNAETLESNDKIQPYLKTRSTSPAETPFTTTAATNYESTAGTPCYCPERTSHKLCDSEISQIVYNVIQKARRHPVLYPLTKAKRFSETTFNDREWYFIGFAARLCNEKTSPGEQRLHTLLRQTPHFDNLFQCVNNRPLCTCDTCVHIF